MRRTIPPCFRDRRGDELDRPISEAPLPLDEVALIAKGLSHPTRLEILTQLADTRPVVAGSIAVDSGLARSTVSEHLRLLNQAGLVDRCQEGSAVRYRLRTQRLEGFVRALDALTDQPLSTRVSPSPVSGPRQDLRP